MARLAEEAGFKPVYMSGGWGDPMHVQRTIALSEAAGFAAIEIEDQLLPRRVEHHVGVEHLVPTEFMVEKVKAAVAARTDPDFVIVARTNARRLSGLDEALRRGEAFKRAGADMIFVFTRTAEEMRILGAPTALPSFRSRSAISRRSASGSPPPPAPPSPPWSRPCANPTNASRKAGSIPSSARATSRRK